MIRKQFGELIKVKDEFKDFNLKVGNRFLLGEKMISQIYMKEVGQPISYYECILSDGKGRCEYIVKYDYLEK